jgi:TRAP-type mannitol/chloroaromatic compound transport system substrate-binding protein
VGWADAADYYLTNNISGAWNGSFFANSERWNELPDHLKTLLRLCMDSSHYYRQHWYWWGEAHYRTQGGKLELTTIPEAEWATVEEEGLKFWDEIAAESPRKARVVEIIKAYRETMRRAGPPYRYG